MSTMADNHPLLGAGWPVHRTYLAGLIELGLSDARIAACFAVDHADVQLLRETYSLDAAPADAFRQAVTGTFTGLALDELSNGLQAALTYVSAAIKCAKRDANTDAMTLLLMEKSLTQLQRVAQAYQTLQMRSPPLTE